MKKLQEKVIWIQLNDLEREREKIARERDFGNLFIKKATKWIQLTTQLIYL